MNIAVIGPEKFAFQDMACIELALSYRPFGAFTLVPEPNDGEDASLIWAAELGQTLEVQVKGAQGIAGVAELAEYFLHYPEREAWGSLFERVFGDDTRFALFILTARCNDDLSPLLQRRPLDGLPTEEPAPRALAEALRDEFGRISNVKPRKNASKLKLARLKNAAVLAARSIVDFERVLAKTSLVDQETAETIEVRLHAILRAEMFDTLSLRGILAELSDLMAVSKRTKADALAPILRELAQRAPNAMLPDGYLERGIEADLEVQLQEEHVLLLAGPPRVGKSWTARAIGGKLQKGGYEVRQGAFVEEAERFLTDPVGAERAYLLDDPIGARESLPDANVRLAALRTLSERIPPNRRLIVSQSEQALLQTRAATNLAACALGGRSWLRLEPLEVERAQAIWQAASDGQALPAPVVERVEQLIAQEPKLRDPGALAYLAQSWDDLQDDPLDAEILHQARKDAVDFARALAASAAGIGDMLTASALATSASEGVVDAELAFIVNGDEDRPGFEPSHSVITVGGRPRPLPVYEVSPLLTEGQQHALETLQRRRVLEERDSLFNFTHPYMRAGAQTLISPDIPHDQERILGQVERALACCSPMTSLAAARNLRWLRQALPANGGSAVFGLARFGIRSLFPATRDYCFEFLIEFVDQLPEELKNEVPHWSERMLIKLEDIDVGHGVGFITDQRNWPSKVSPLAHVQPYLDAIEEGEPIALDLSLSQRLLHTLDENPAALTHAAVRRFLRADEAVVRAAAARIWCRLPHEEDGDILARLDGDAAPAISVAILNQLVQSWDGLVESRRERILDILVTHASSPGCASVLHNRLVLFNRVERFGKQPPWPVFAKLMPVVIEHLPLSVPFENGRLNYVLTDAMRELPPETLSPLVKTWSARLLRRIKRYFLTEFELAIVDPLLKLADGELRLQIIRDLFGTADTGARVVTVKSLTDNWEALNSTERELLKDVLAESGDDARWLAATVLTMQNPPDSLVTTLIGDPQTLLLAANEMELKIGTTLFSACVHMFVGWPQPLWWYGTHHSQSPIWARVIRQLSSTPNHDLHAVAFYEVASFGVESELAELVDSLPEPDLPDTFQRLLNYKISHVADWRRDAWQRLLARGAELQLLDGFIAQIDAELEGILEDLTDIGPWLGKGDFASQILELLPNDLKALSSLRTIRKTHKAMQEELKEMDGAVSAKAEEVFARLCAEELVSLKAEPPRLHGSWSEVSRTFKELGAKTEILEEVDARRLEAIKHHQSIRDRFTGAPPHFELAGWVDQARLGPPDQ